MGAEPCVHGIPKGEDLAQFCEATGVDSGEAAGSAGGRGAPEPDESCRDERSD